jgi:hypothetical protein
MLPPYNKALRRGIPQNFSRTQALVPSTGLRKKNRPRALQICKNAARANNQQQQQQEAYNSMNSMHHLLSVYLS